MLVSWRDDGLALQAADQILPRPPSIATKGAFASALTTAGYLVGSQASVAQNVRGAFNMLLG